MYHIRPALIGIATTALLVALIYATAQRNLVYDTEVTFWEDTAVRNPTNARAANNLGMAYAINCQFDEAASEFQRSIELDRSDYRASINLLLLRRGELPGAEKHRCAYEAP